MTLTFHAVRLERIQPVVLTQANVVKEGDLSRWQKPDRLVPIDGQIHTWAKEVVDIAHAQTDLEMARAIYNHVVSVKAGDAAISTMPATRFASGFSLPADRGAGKIGGYQCWAEFYAKGIGWVPVDASEAAKNPTKREFFFGAHDENRVELSRGRDVVLTPKQQGDPLNYFVYPCAEVDGKQYANLETASSHQDSLR